VKPVKILPLSQVEYAVDDLDRVQQFFTGIFGEFPVEEQFAGALSNELLEIRHVGFGQTVQQLCRPTMPGLPHYDALQAHGSCVHNLCFMVDNIDHMAANCREAGFASLIDFPLDELWPSLIEADNLAGNHHAYIFDTRDVLGFQLELAEVPWEQEPEPALMLPAFCEHWQGQGKASANLMTGLNVAVADVAAAIESLQLLFGAELEVLEAPAAVAGMEMIRARVELGAVSINYLQPTSNAGELAEFLASRGNAVHSLVATVGDLSATRARLSQSGVELLTPAACWLWDIEDPEVAAQGCQVRSLQSVGVEFMLSGV
jgi:catechol 2,3-dioxygenase-like lactoylglutathione lyase family enzyme